MKQEDKQLLLKDLCSRLPYGVKVKVKYYDNVCKLLAIYTNGTTYATRDVGYPIETYFEDCKPYLFPLSSMTKEQYKEWCDLEEEPLDEILTRNANGIKMTTLEHHLLVAKGMIDPIQWCYKNHFDVYGLIPMGLAIDATGLNVY